MLSYRLQNNLTYTINLIILSGQNLQVFIVKTQWGKVSADKWSKHSPYLYKNAEDPTNKSGLGILLHHEVPKCRMIGQNFGFGP